MTQFSVLRVGSYTQYRFAWYEYEAMDVVRSTPPQEDYCRLCGPGGGGKNGIRKSIARVVMMEPTWTGEDVFFAINFAGTILVCEKAADMIVGGDYTNGEVVPCEKYTHSFLA